MFPFLGHGLRGCGLSQPIRQLILSSTSSNFHRRRPPLNGCQYGERQLSTILLPPMVFIGLGSILWAYKCLMMVVFQNKILYMPNVPPFSRSEKVEDYAQRCSPIKWEEEYIVASDKTRLSILSADIDVGSRSSRSDSREDSHLLILFFQGNASSLPPRTPYLADTMKTVSRLASTDASIIGKRKISFLGVSYRGFWHSRGRPSQKGIELDAAAALDWAVKKYSSTTRPRIVLWGESIGSGVALTAAATYRELRPMGSDPKVLGLILETPFTNLSNLLRDFYPQKWLPYRYLTPFLRSHWDSKIALQRIAEAPGDEKPKLLILQASKDEVVPGKHGEELEGWGKKLNLDIERRIIQGALHTEIKAKPAGREEIARYLLRFL